MKFKIPKLVPADKDVFLEFWSSRYSYPNSELYDENIGKPLNEDRILKLYRWKRSLILSGNLNHLVKNVYVPTLRELPVITTEKEGKEYIEKFRINTKKQRRGIWDIFWLHCLNPKQFPIFDQHTYRAMAYMDDLPLKEIPNSGHEKIDIYFSKYIDFVFKLGTNLRKIDKALFEYGKFLKTNINFFK